MRGLPSTFGRVDGSILAMVFSEASDKAKPSMSRTMLERQRIEPSFASVPGFSAPGGPYRKSFMTSSLVQAMILTAPPIPPDAAAMNWTRVRAAGCPDGNIPGDRMPGPPLHEGAGRCLIPAGSRQSRRKRMDQADAKHLFEPTGDFQCLHEFIPAARAKLSDHIWGYLVGAAESETTMRRNRLALDTLALRPRVCVDVSKIELGTTLFGREWRMPVILAPVGSLESFEPGGAATAGRAASAFGV